MSTVPGCRRWAPGAVASACRAPSCSASPYQSTEGGLGGGGCVGKDTEESAGRGVLRVRVGGCTRGTEGAGGAGTCWGDGRSSRSRTSGDSRSGLGAAARWVPARRNRTIRTAWTPRTPVHTRALRQDGHVPVAISSRRSRWLSYPSVTAPADRSSVRKPVARCSCRCRQHDIDRGHNP